MPRVSETPPAGPDADGRSEGTPSTSSTASTAHSRPSATANGHQPQLQRLSRSSRFTTEAEQEPKQVWSFSSSGWLFVYHFGAVKALKQLGLERWDPCASCNHAECSLHPNHTMQTRFCIPDTAHGLAGFAPFVLEAPQQLSLGRPCLHLHCLVIH